MVIVNLRVGVFRMRVIGDMIIIVSRDCILFVEF